jgi:D-amino peptidase
MKVFISVDMEGVTGVTDPEDVLPAGSDYQRGRVFMTGDANAAVLGAFDAGATEVLVNDSHWIMRNLLLELMDPRARVIKGINKPLCMVQGVDETFAAAIFIGYHSCAGTEHGVLNHTLLGKEIQNVLLEGEPIGRSKAECAALRPLRRARGLPLRRHRRMPRGAERDWGGSPNLAVKDGIRHVHRLLPPPGGDAKGHSGGRCPRPQGDGEDAAAPLPREDAVPVRLRMEHHDHRLDLRAHSDRRESQSADHRIQNGQPAASHGAHPGEAFPGLQVGRNRSTAEALRRYSLPAPPLPTS